LYIIDHKLDNDKVVSVIGRAARGDLRLRRTEEEDTKKNDHS
jgi:hypothetical protein